MKNNFIPAETSFAQWNKDPKYAAAYAALDEEFAEAAASIALIDEKAARITPRR